MMDEARRAAVFENTQLVEAEDFMGIISKTCGRCGRSVPVTASVGGRCPHCGVTFGYEKSGANVRCGGPDWGAALRTGIVLSLLALVFVVPVFLVRSRTLPIERYNAQLLGDSAECLAAASGLRGKSKYFVSRIAPAYLQALRTSEDATRIVLIRTLAEVEKGLRERRTGGVYPLLPDELVIGMRALEDDPNLGVRQAVADTLQAIGAD